MFSFMWRQYRHRTPNVTVPEGHVLPPEEVRRQLAQHDGRDSLTWLGHASFLIRIGGKVILTDPYLGEVAGPSGLGPKRYVPPALAVGQLPTIDVLLVSHNHYDHLDRPTLLRLANKDRMTVAVPLRLGPYFERLGYVQVHELDWHERVDCGGVQVTALPAIHFSRRGPFDRNRSLWAGFAIKHGNKQVYFSGDTAYGDVFGEIGARHGPFDLAIVGIGAYLPARIMQASHTTPEEAVRLAQDINARSVLGMHWGTVMLTEEEQFEPPTRFRQAAETAGYDRDQVWLMAIGETRALPGDWPEN